MFEVLVHRSRFKAFKKGASGLVSSLPANDDDEFASVMVRDMNGTLGFDVCAESRKVLRSLLSECYCFNALDSIYAPDQWGEGEVPHFFLKDKGGALREMIAMHDRCMLNVKKYNVVPRRGSVERPLSPLLAGLALGARPIR